MSYAVSRPADGGIRLRYFGDVTAEDLVAAQREAFGEPSPQNIPFAYIYGDWMDAETVTLPTDLIHQVATRRRAMLQANPKLRSVAVVKSDYVFGLARMWQSMLGDEGDKARIFRSAAEAEDWLRRTLNLRAKPRRKPGKAAEPADR